MSYLELAKKIQARLKPPPHDATPEAVDPIEGRIIACLIQSEVLGATIWFALDDSFNPDDGLAVFYADESEFLKSKDTQTLRKIHETKLAFGPGSRVRQ